MQNDKYPFAPPLDGADKPAPRRRRHRRSGARRPGASQNQQTDPAAQATRQNKQGGPAAQAARQNKQGGPAAQAGRQKQAAQAKPAQGQNAAPRPENRRPQRAERQRPAQPQRAPAVPEDPGLPLIARRPPKQKYANFEEYIAAHGGVTAPLPGDDTPPAPPAEEE